MRLGRYLDVEITLVHDPSARRGTPGRSVAFRGGGASGAGADPARTDRGTGRGPAADPGADRLRTGGEPARTGCGPAAGRPRTGCPSRPNPLRGPSPLTDVPADAGAGTEAAVVIGPSRAGLFRPSTSCGVWWASARRAARPPSSRRPDRSARPGAAGPARPAQMPDALGGRADADALTGPPPALLRGRRVQTHHGRRDARRGGGEGVPALADPWPISVRRDASGGPADAQWGSATRGRRPGRASATRVTRVAVGAGCGKTFCETPARPLRGGGHGDGGRGPGTASPHAGGATSPYGGGGAASPYGGGAPLHTRAGAAAPARGQAPPPCDSPRMAHPNARVISYLR